MTKINDQSADDRQYWVATEKTPSRHRADLDTHNIPRYWSLGTVVPQSNFYSHTDQLIADHFEPASPVEALSGKYPDHLLASSTTRERLFGAAPGYAGRMP